MANPKQDSLKGFVKDEEDSVEGGIKLPLAIPSETEILRQISEEVTAKGKGYIPQEGHRLEYLPGLSMPDVSVGFNSMPMDTSRTELEDSGSHKADMLKVVRNTDSSSFQKDSAFSSGSGLGPYRNVNEYLASTSQLCNPFLGLAGNCDSSIASTSHSNNAQIATKHKCIGMARRYTPSLRWMNNEQTVFSLEEVRRNLGNNIYHVIKEKSPWQGIVHCYRKDNVHGRMHVLLRLQYTRNMEFPMPEVTSQANWLEIAGPVRQQWNHDLCWGFVATDLVSALRIIEGLDTKFRMLSVKQLCFHANPEKRKAWTDVEDIKHECYSLTLDDAFDYIIDEGVIEETGTDPDAKFCCINDIPNLEEDQPKYTIGNYDDIGNNIGNIYDRLAIQPLGAVVAVFSPEFENTTSAQDIYRGPTSSNSEFVSFHGVMVLSVETVEGEPVFYCKSSNGEESLDKGFIRISGSTYVMGAHYDGQPYPRRGVLAEEDNVAAEDFDEAEDDNVAAEDDNVAAANSEDALYQLHSPTALIADFIRPLLRASNKRRSRKRQRETKLQADDANEDVTAKDLLERKRKGKQPVGSDGAYKG